LEQEIKRIHRGEQLAVLYIDIDEFKTSTIRSTPDRR